VEASNPSVSLLIPSYNQAGHIRQVVEAALNQTHPPDEIVVVDDASTDESVEILRHLPVKLICHEVNRGPAIARNTALQSGSGDIVIYIDADAYADQQMIEAILQAYHWPSKVPVGGVGGRAVEVNVNSIYDRWRTLHARQSYGLAPRENVQYLFGLCMSYKREALVKVGGFDPFFPINAGEDLDIGYRLLNAGYRLRYTPDAFVYHQHSDTEEKLKRIQYNWYYWSYLAKKRTGFHPWTLYAGTFRRLFVDTLADLIIRRDPKLSRLDLEIFKIKLAAMRDAEKYIGGKIAIK
jgi:glycosyltransferase involved in cell wall biosynthesis